VFKKGPIKLKKLANFSEIYENYDTFIIDLWGVIHNGIHLYEESVDVVEKLISKNKKVIFLSNAPRPSENVIKFLKKIEMKEKYLKNVMTSGEAAMKVLKNLKYGKNFFHLGPKRDNPLFFGLEENKTSLEKCDFILCTGLIENHEKDLQYYKDLLRKNLHKKLICTNPDLIVHRGDDEEYCAGTIAKIFESIGGKVIYIGKPYKEIYNIILKKNERNFIIGDNLNTDIRGANNLSLDCLFITNGVHKSEFNNENDLDDLLKKYKVTSNFFQKNLRW
tara:strand:- start:1169 stop:1999 length:831 start_codon:yes stop_codon:yes gene_type:complete